MITLRIAALAATVVLLAVTDGTSQAASPAGAPDAVCTSDASAAASTAIARWQMAIGSGDVNAIASLYDETATLLTADAERELHGRRSIAAYYAGLLQRHPMAHIDGLSIVPGCTSATVEGSILLRVTGVRKGTRMLLAGAYRARLEHFDGGWVIKRHELVLEPRAIKPLAGS